MAAHGEQRTGFSYCKQRAYKTNDRVRAAGLPKMGGSVYHRLVAGCVGWARAACDAARPMERFGENRQAILASTASKSTYVSPPRAFPVPNGRFDAQRQCPIASHAAKRSVFHGHATRRGGQYLRRWILYTCEQGRVEYDVCLRSQALGGRVEGPLLYGFGWLGHGRSHRDCSGLRWVRLCHRQYELIRFSGDCRGATASLYRRWSNSRISGESQSSRIHRIFHLHQRCWLHANQRNRPRWWR